MLLQELEYTWASVFKMFLHAESEYVYSLNTVEVAVLMMYVPSSAMVQMFKPYAVPTTRAVHAASL